MKTPKTLIINFGIESIKIANQLIENNSLINEYKYIAIDKNLKTLNISQLEDKILIENWESDQFSINTQLHELVIKSTTIFLLVDFKNNSLSEIQNLISYITEQNKKVNLISFKNSDFQRIEEHFMGNKMCSIFMLNNIDFQNENELFSESDILQLKSKKINDYLKFYYHIYNNDYIEEKENILNQFNNSAKINILTAWASGSNKSQKILSKIISKKTFFENSNKAVLVLEHSLDTKIDDLYTLINGLKEINNLDYKLILVKNDENRFKVTIFSGSEHSNQHEETQISNETKEDNYNFTLNSLEDNDFDEDENIFDDDELIFDNSYEEKEQIIIDYSDTSDIEF
ncbi:hypothetical protein [Mycoplasma sp. OR1901]|uniref:hypothetical protein n=1 Tax=Mycoplasma sp. OR1901 TaxID=2742195 RepID=UPI0015835EAF|nr:hypothetical protein [Mycoplasma sp. OR1901]QKT05391.1 hypothetical protein HTZ87_01595 [Mycoplasma sp. OR1901]